MPKQLKAFANALKSPGTQTLAMEVVDRAGSARQGLNAFYWIAAWGTYADAHGGEPPNVEAVAQWVQMSRRTVFGWQAEFRDIFDEYKTPAALWSQVSEQVTTSADYETIAFEMGGAHLEE